MSQDGSAHCRFAALKAGLAFRRFFNRFLIACSHEHLIIKFSQLTISGYEEYVG